MHLSGTAMVGQCTSGIAVRTIIIRCGVWPASRSRQPMGNVWMQVSGKCGVKVQLTPTRVLAITTCAETLLDIPQFGAILQTQTNDGRIVVYEDLVCQVPTSRSKQPTENVWMPVNGTVMVA